LVNMGSGLGILLFFSKITSRSASEMALETILGGKIITLYDSEFSNFALNSGDIIYNSETVKAVMRPR